MNIKIILILGLLLLGAAFIVLTYIKKIPLSITKFIITMAVLLVISIAYMVFVRKLRESSKFN